MTKYESSVKLINYPQASIYAKLADLNNLAFIQQRSTDPAFVEQVRASGQVTDEQIEKMQQAVAAMTFTQDSITIEGTPLGALTLCIVERDEPKCIKLELQNAPIAGNLWIQIIPSSAYTSKMKCTVGADLNFFMKQMAKKPLQEGVEKLAEMLAMIPYGY